MKLRCHKAKINLLWTKYDDVMSSITYSNASFGIKKSISQMY